MRRRLSGLLLLFVLLLSVEAQVPVEIRTNNVKARKTPSTTAAVIANLHKGEVFVITADEPYWYEITLRNGKSAWVRKSSCTVVDQPETDSQVPTNLTNPIPPASSQPVTSEACSAKAVP